MELLVDCEGRSWLDKKYIIKHSNFVTDIVKGNYHLMKGLPPIRSSIIKKSIINLITTDDKWIQLRDNKMKIMDDNIIDIKTIQRSLLILKTDNKLYHLDDSLRLLANGIIDCSVCDYRNIIAITTDRRAIIFNDRLDNWMELPITVNHRILDCNRIVTYCNQVYYINCRSHPPQCQRLDPPPQCIDYDIICYLGDIMALHIDYYGKLWSHRKNGVIMIDHPLLIDKKMSYLISNEISGIIVVDEDGISYHLGYDEDNRNIKIVRLLLPRLPGTNNYPLLRPTKIMR